MKALHPQAQALADYLEERLVESTYAKAATEILIKQFAESDYNTYNPDNTVEAPILLLSTETLPPGYDLEAFAEAMGDYFSHSWEQAFNYAWMELKSEKEVNN